jgi:hypothetical protein
VQTTPYVVATSVPPPTVGTSLMTCSNADARHAARWILQYVESLKDICSFADLLILVLVALITRLEAVKKVMSEAARLAADQFLAEEKAAQQAADQSPRSSQETNAALNRDL